MKYIRLYEQFNDIDNKETFKSLINWDVVHTLEKKLTELEDKGYDIEIECYLVDSYRDYTGRRERKFTIWFQNNGRNVYKSDYTGYKNFYGFDEEKIKRDYLLTLFEKNGMYYEFKFDRPSDDPLIKLRRDLVMGEDWLIRDNILKKIASKYTIKLTSKYDSGAGFIIKNKI